MKRVVAYKKVQLIAAAVFLLTLSLLAISVQAALPDSGTSILVTTEGVVTDSSKIGISPASEPSITKNIITVTPGNGQPFTKAYEVNVGSTTYSYTDPNTVFFRITLDKMSTVPVNGDWMYISYYVRAVQPTSDYTDSAKYGLLIRKQGSTTTTISLLNYGETVPVSGGWQKKTIITKFTKSMSTVSQLDFAIGNVGNKQCLQFADVRAVYFGAVSGSDDDDKKAQIQNFVDNANLKDMKLNNTSFEGFEQTVYSYTYTMPFDSVSLINVSDIWVDPINPRVSFTTQVPPTIPGSIKVKVVPENYDAVLNDITKIKTYEISVVKQKPPYILVQQNKWKFKKDSTDITKIDEIPCNTISSETAVVNYNSEEHTVAMFLCLYKDDELIRIGVNEYTIQPDQIEHNIISNVDTSDITDWKNVYVKAFLRKGITNPCPANEGKKISLTGIE